MLRIAGPSGPPSPDVPVDLAVPVDPQVQPAPPVGVPRFSGQKVSPEVARYLGPEAGPFECQGCDHFMEPNSCGIVEGQIDPKGVCCLFTKAAAPEGPPSEPGPEPPGELDVAPEPEVPVPPPV